MDLKRLRTFVAVADFGTVSKAALRLRISQSALSRQIGDLEHECGFKLFDRVGRRLFLTTRGQQLLAEAGQGVAVIPSMLRTDRYKLKIVRVTHRQKPLRDRYVIQWDKRRPMPSYAQKFCAELAAYMRERLPITRPSLR